jgi:hypothetical protein
MAVTIKNTKYFYPPRPGNGTDTFSDNIVGLQTVDGGGLTQGNFEFTVSVVEKVNRTFNIGAFDSPVSLEDLGIKNDIQSKIISQQFRVYPNFDISQVLNFSLYGSLAKRFSVSITKIINYFPASLDVRFLLPNYTTGDTALNISYDSTNDETYFEVNVDRIFNPFGIEYSQNGVSLTQTGNTVSKYRNINNTYLDYAISIDDIDYKVNSFSPSVSPTFGTIAFYVSGSPFGTTASTYSNTFQIRPNDLIVDEVFTENFDEIEQFLLNRLIVPIYTSVFKVPQQDEFGQFYVSNQNVTWPKDGQWNLDIRTVAFDDYLYQLQQIADNIDSFKTNLISRFLTSGSLKEFDTLGRKVEKVFQIYGRSFDELKKYVDALAFMNSVNYNPSNDIPNELLDELAMTLGWNGNFSPITNLNYVQSIFGNKKTPDFPGYARAQTATELNYSFYRNLILNSAYFFKSKGTRRSVEFLLNLIGAPESLIEYNEHVYLADQKVDMSRFYEQFGLISGGTYVEVKPALDPTNIFRFRGVTYTGYTTSEEYFDVAVDLENYPVDDEGYPSAPLETEDMFFQKGAGWYEQTPEHTSDEELVITGNVYKGQNPSIQTQLQPFTYGQLYLDVFRSFPYMREGFKLQKTQDNLKSWVSTDDKIRQSTDANYNSLYYVDNEKLVLNVKNIDLFLNPGQGLVYDVWYQSRTYNYPIPESGLTEWYPVPGGVDSTFIKPDPQQKTFYEFARTFWLSMINVRNRLFITDGKTGGYPTLQSIFWKYLEQTQNIGYSNNNYTYQKLIDYVNGINPYWMKLVEQAIPATTIWQTGVRLENSVLHRQKFMYRRQRGCVLLDVPTQSCVINSTLVPYTTSSEIIQLSIFPWLNNPIGVSSMNGVLLQTLNSYLTSIGQTLATCAGANNLISQWYVDIRLGNTILVQELFFTGNGINGVPTNSQWKTALVQFLPRLVFSNLGYFVNGNQLTVFNLGTQSLFLNQNFSLNIGINLNFTC